MRHINQIDVANDPGVVEVSCDIVVCAWVKWRLIAVTLLILGGRARRRFLPTDVLGGISLGRIFISRVLIGRISLGRILSSGGLIGVRGVGSRTCHDGDTRRLLGGKVRGVFAVSEVEEQRGVVGIGMLWRVMSSGGEWVVDFN